MIPRSSSPIPRATPGAVQAGTFALLDAMTGPFLSKIAPEPLADDPRDAEIARLREANAVLSADIAMALDALRELIPYAAHASAVVAAIEGEPLVGAEFQQVPRAVGLEQRREAEQHWEIQPLYGRLGLAEEVGGSGLGDGRGLREVGGAGPSPFQHVGPEVPAGSHHDRNPTLPARPRQRK